MSILASCCEFDTMVIKHNWNLVGQNVVGDMPFQQASSSEDSNSSWQTMSSTATSNAQSRSTVSGGVSGGAVDTNKQQVHNICMLCK